MMLWAERWSGTSGRFVADAGVLNERADQRNERPAGSRLATLPIAAPAPVRATIWLRGWDFRASLDTVTSHDPHSVRVGGVALDLERLTYATIVVMAVLSAYAGWTDLSFPAAVVVVVSPLVAVCLAHAFSELLHEHASVGRTLTTSEWLAVARRQLHLLLAALPPLAVLGIGRVTSFGTADTLPAVEVTGMVTLAFLSGLASRRAGLRGLWLALGSLAGGLLGLTVIALQIVLKPH